MTRPFPRPGIYAWSHGAGGVSWYRQREPLRVADLNGINVGMGAQLDDDVAGAFDTILVHMLWDEHASRGWQELAHGRRHRLVMDIDDMMWDPDWKPFQEHYRPDVLSRVELNISLADVVTTPSPAIAAYIQTKLRHPNVHVCPNTVPQWLTRVRMPARPAPELWPYPLPPQVIGYQGSPSHAHDWPPELQVELERMIERHPSWAMHFWGPNDVGSWNPRTTGVTGWTDSLRNYYLSLSMDIGLGPLKNTYFNRCKSGLRAVEYAALGIAAVLPGIPPYVDPHTPRGIGQLLPGITGYATVAHDDGHIGVSGAQAAEMTRLAVEALIQDPERRETIERTARQVAGDWTTEKNIDLWTDAWNSV